MHEGKKIEIDINEEGVIFIKKIPDIRTVKGAWFKKKFE